MAGPEGKPVSSSRKQPGLCPGAQSPACSVLALRAGSPVCSDGVAQIQVHTSDGCVCAQAHVYCP